MKKKILILILLLCLPALSQFQSQVNQWRVVTVSPNYRNVYPRFSTMQNAFNSCVDSANAGKYFIVNIASAVQNITDYTSAWKDSIIAHYPNMVLTAFGVTVNDSITAVTPEEFTLVAGLLGLNGAIAGSGLSFTSHQLAIIVNDYLGNVLYVDGDSLKLRTDGTLLRTPNLLGVNLKYNSGILSDTGGIGVQTIAPLQTVGDNVSLRYKQPFILSNDTLSLDANPDQFTIIEVPFYTPSLNLHLDSGITSSTSGVKAWIDNKRITFATSGSPKITLPSTLAGTGLIWTGDSLNVGLSYQFQPYNDSLWIDFNTDEFRLVYGLSPAVNIKLDSGMNTSATGIKPKIDYSTLIFNSLLQLVVNPTLAGGGLLMTAGVIGIVPNDFAKVENDTLKIKTSSVLTWFGDSLTSTIFYVPPYDTLGIGMFAKGNVKRVAINYVTDNGNDTTVMNFLDASWNAYDRIALVWDNSQMKFKIYKNKILWQTLAGCANLTSPYKKDWNVAMETYLEAQ